MKALTINRIADDGLPPLPQRNTDWPLDKPLVYDDVKAALWHASGNIKGAAELLRTSPARIAALLAKDVALSEQRRLASELQIDAAEAVILEALTDDEDKLRKDDAARFVLLHAGKLRGWSRDGGDVKLAFNNKGEGAMQAGGVTVRWESDPAPAPKVIDATDK